MKGIPSTRRHFALGIDWFISGVKMNGFRKQGGSVHPFSEHLPSLVWFCDVTMWLKPIGCVALPGGQLSNCLSSKVHFALFCLNKCSTQVTG